MDTKTSQFKSNVNPIENYYIAYFDVLGYKEFFETKPNEVPALLESIDDAIIKTKAFLATVNTIVGALGSEDDLKIKIFSDNILVCLKIQSNENDVGKALVFLYLIDVVGMENNAIYPRIAIDDAVVEKMKLGIGKYKNATIEKKDKTMHRFSNHYVTEAFSNLIISFIVKWDDGRYVLRFVTNESL